jgi:DoxX-like family
MHIITWFLRIVAALIMLQTLYFKFSASEESVFIFSTLKMEPYGRIGLGVAELIASILLLVPKTTFWGAILSMGIMAGAIASHLTQLGIVVKGDGGQLFIYALVVFACSAVLAYIERATLFKLLKKS